PADHLYLHSFPTRRSSDLALCKSWQCATEFNQKSIGQDFVATDLKIIKMGLKYFKSRKRFDFSPHPFDVGNIFGLKTGLWQQSFSTQNLRIGQSQICVLLHLPPKLFPVLGSGCRKRFPFPCVVYRAETD